MRSASNAEHWRVSEDVPQDLHLMLYIRDALGLRHRQADDEPPQLTPRIPRVGNASGTLATDSARWLRWWREIVPVHAWVDRAESVPARRALLKRLDELGAAPEFGGLSDVPSLQRAALELVEQATAWSHRLTANEPPWSRTEGIVSYAMIEEVLAEERRAGHIGTAGRRLTLLVLHVEGTWWHVPSPGTLLLSLNAATHPDSSHRAIRTALRPAG